MSTFVWELEKKSGVHGSPPCDRMCSFRGGGGWGGGLCYGSGLYRKSNIKKNKIGKNNPHTPSGWGGGGEGKSAYGGAGMQEVFSGGRGSRLLQKEIGGRGATVLSGTATRWGTP